jgi:formamidopyrimidine-DNA glycosylase
MSRNQIKTMPELPEIETICQALKANILNKVIIKTNRLTEFNLRKAIPKDISQKLSNRKIIDITRRAKYIQISLDNSLILLIHLGMSGKFLIKDKDYSYQKHDHLSLILDDEQKLIYNDPRRFGLIEILDSNQLENSPFLKHLGIEPFSVEFTSQYLGKILSNKKQPIKLTIMDNINIVGVGNIYAAESLFLSGVKPDRPSSSLEKQEITLLHSKILQVLEEAIKQGGSTLKDYASANGDQGYFQHSFKVYGRDGKDCIVCKEIIQKIKQGGRASFYCPKCQK